MVIPNAALRSTGPCGLKVDKYHVTVILTPLSASATNFKKDVQVHNQHTDYLTLAGVKLTILRARSPSTPKQLRATARPWTCEFHASNCTYMAIKFLLTHLVPYQRLTSSFSSCAHQHPELLGCPTTYLIMACERLTYSYVGVYEREITHRDLEITVKITPSLHTNVPPASLQHQERETLKFFTESDGWDEEPYIVRSHSFGRIIWYLDDGFPGSFAFNQEVTVDGLTTHILDIPKFDDEHAIIWFPTLKVNLKTHRLPVRKGLIGVPYTRGWLPIHIKYQICLARYIPYVPYNPFFIHLLPTYCNTHPLELCKHAFQQGDMRQILRRSYTKREFSQEMPFGNLPFDGRAPWIILTDSFHYQQPGRSQWLSDAEILCSYFS